MKNTQAYLLIAAIFLLTGAGVYSNVMQQRSIDKSKIPEEVENNNSFQRWITNLKNKDVEIEADDFRLIEENEIYNTKWMKVFSIEEEGMQEKYDNYMKAHKDLRKVIFSPSERLLIDYRNEPRDGYKPNEVHFYGLLEDKLIDARIVDCSEKANCIFDRAYFLENEIFVVSEFSRNIDKKDENAPACKKDETCAYTFKIHLIDLKNNSRLVYESEPFETIYNETVPEL